MPVITSIKPQKSGKRINVYLDGKFGFGIDLDNFVQQGLKVEQFLEDTEVEKIVKKAEFQKTLDKLLRFATLRPRSESEVRGWMSRKKVHESLKKDLFSKLRHLELIDDEKFARWWVEQRLQFKPKAKRILDNELRIKGIKKEIIEDVLGSTEVDEVKIAKDLLEKKKYRWEKLPKIEAKRKMSDFLARKGFGWEVIKKIFDLTSNGNE
jgi:regulatory protein